MPEIPDLEAVRHYLMPRLAGLKVTHTAAPIPWLVRTGAEDLATLGATASARSTASASSCCSSSTTVAYS